MKISNFKYVKILEIILISLCLCASMLIFFHAISTDARTSSLAASKKLAKEEGAHFELYLDLWEVMAELRDENNNVYYLTFCFYRSGPYFMELRYYLAGLYDVKEGRYYHETRGDKLLTEAARRELRQKAENFPENTFFADAAERIKNSEYRNFTALNQPPTIYKSRLFIQHDSFHFKRISQNLFLYSLHFPVEGKIVSLSLESFTDPIVYDNKNPIAPGDGTDLRSYAFPEMRFQGTITTDEKKLSIYGKGWYYHIWGLTS
ncbi:MAG: lipocalin-like domain-containing protein, partial [bacterium]